MKYKTMDSDLSDRSILEKLLRIDNQTAQVMALDMLTAGVDTVSTYEILTLQNDFNPRRTQLISQIHISI